MPTARARRLNICSESTTPEFTIRGCELIREPGLSRRAPPIPQLGQETPLGVQHAHLAEPVHMVFGGNVMELQALDLAAETRDRLARLADELLHQFDRLKLLLKRAVE